MSQSNELHGTMRYLAHISYGENKVKTCERQRLPTGTLMRVIHSEEGTFKEGDIFRIELDDMSNSPLCKVVLSSEGTEGELHFMSLGMLEPLEESYVGPEGNDG